jgi:hypothetical protein
MTSQTTARGRVRRGARRPRLRRALWIVAGTFALLATWQAGVVAPGFASSVESTGRRPMQPTLSAVFARSIGIARSRVRLGAQTRTRRGIPVRLWIVRGWTSSDVCVALQVASRPPLATACGGAEPVAGSIGLVVGPAAEDRYRPGTVIGGLAARSTAHVRLRFTDDSAIVVPVHAGAWVTELPPRISGRTRLRRITPIAAAAYGDG